MPTFRPEATQWEARCLDRPLPSDAAEAPPEQRLAVIVAFVRCEHIDLAGGDPWPMSWEGDTLIVRSEGRQSRTTEERRYSRQELLDWYERAVAYQHRFQDPDLTLTDVLYETAPRET